GKVKADFDITQHWSVAVAAKDESKSGTGRIGTGTYIRRQTVNSFDRNRFEPRSHELPLPVDWKDRSYGLGTGFHHQGWFFNAGWQESSFTNSIGSLTWDNPFEGLPGATSSRTGLTPGSDQEPSGATANTNNRGRFAQAQLDLYPDNDYERFNMTGGVNLPARTRVNASYSAASMKQNDPFLAYTINPAVIYGNGADGVGGTPDDVLAKDVALPRASLDGEIQTTRLDLRVTSRPLDPLSLRGAYRVYEYDDKTPSILFPGYASAGDSYFRPGIGQRNAAGTRVLFNEPGGYKRTSWSAGGAWRFGDPATLDVEYVNTGMDYDERQVKSTSEEQLSAKLRLAFGENFEARLTYLDASRDADGIYHVGFETSRLRAFDVWNRDRTRYGVELSWMLAEGTTFGFVYQNWQDDFPGVLPEPTPPSTSNPYPSQAYGLNETANDSLALSLSHGAENWNLSVSVGLDSSQWTSEATAKTTLTGDSPQFSPTNAWRRIQDDDVLWAGLAFDTKLGAKGKLDIQIDYNDYDGSYDTVNLGTPTVNDGVAYAVPNFSSSLLSGQVAYSWELNEHFGLGAKYLYEPYKLDDWQWDLVEPYMQGILRETGGSPTAIRDATANRLLFLDSTYSDYTANVFALFVTIRY
ncbi:MAG: MtrB/PioB family outer membrane beta-barrel protein, partial [Thermoanaerobaculia bacterium]